MALKIEKYMHILGVNSLRGLLIYLGMAYIISFLLLTLVVYPLAEFGFIGKEAGFLLAAIGVLSLVTAALSIMIPVKLKQENIDNNFPVFIAFLGSIATAKTSYEEFFKTLAETEEYGEISKEMKRLYHLAKDWKLGYATACKVVADTTPSKLFSNFLSRLSQVIEYGEDINFFFRSQYRDIIRDIQTTYQKAVHGLNTTAELLSALFVSSAFMIAFAMLMPIFFPIDYILIAFLAAIAFFITNVLVFAVARSSAPPDRLANKPPETCREHTLSLISTAIGVPTALIFFMAGFVLGLPPIYQVGFSALPLIVPAILSTIAENTIRKREESYIPFIRTLGDIATIREGAITPVLRQLRRHVYPHLTHLIDRLYKRLAITRNVFESFKLFSKEIGSAFISKFNELFAKALYAGADPRETGSIIGDQMHTIVDARRVRLQVAASARGMIYGTFIGVALGVFFAVKSIAYVFNMFSEIFSSVQQEVAAYFTFFNFNINLTPLVDFTVYLFAFEAVFLSLLIKLIDGGLMSGSTKHYVLMIISLVIVYFITDYVLSFLFPMAKESASIPVPGVGK